MEETSLDMARMGAAFALFLEKVESRILNNISKVLWKLKSKVAFINKVERSLTN